MGENHFAPRPVAFYGAVLLFAAVAHFVLTRMLISNHGDDSALPRAMGKDFKCKASVAFYAVATLSRS